jgi:N6-L-threonylcarbamoyladenine synthase
MKILAIETSCDDTCAAVLKNDRVLSNVISSQTDLHAKWGGVVPDIAKRAHESRINAVIAEALLRSKFLISNFQFLKNKEEKINKIIEEGMKEIDVIGVTQGPGLAIALGIGVNKAKDLAKKYNKKLVAVNHIEGHIWANFLKNKNGKPKRELELPALALTVSGGHTKIILINQKEECLISNDQFLNQNLEQNSGQKINYEVVGETLDDAAGEALDKAAKMLGLGYPGGPIIERLARDGKTNFLELPHPLADKKILDYSFSGLKTSFYYKVKDWPKEKIYQNLNNLAATFQNAVFETLLRKYKLAIEKYQPKLLLASGGVLANLELRKRLRKLAKEMNLPIFMPSHKNLNTDNAAMIGRVAYNKALMEEYVDDVDSLDRDPRLRI